jgi:hypothetical protein
LEFEELEALDVGVNCRRRHLLRMARFPFDDMLTGEINHALFDSENARDGFGHFFC